MFTRTIELTTKPNVKPEFFKTLKAEVLPILKKAPGFFDVVVLQHHTVTNKFFFFSFWETQKDADHYEKEWYPKVKTIIEPFYTAPPTVTYWTVEETFSEKLFAKTMV